MAIKTPKLKYEDAKKPLTIEITAKHVKLAVCSNPSACVVAQALLDNLGELFERVEVGATVTKIITATKVLRYRTPRKLQLAIPNFDRTGQWSLEPGKYVLGVYKKPSRQHLIKREAGGKLTTIKLRAVAVRTRQVQRADVIYALDSNI